MSVRDGTYLFSGEALMCTTTAGLLRWLCEPELMSQWMIGVEQVEILVGDPFTRGARTAVTLSTSFGRFGSGGWRLLGQLDDIDETRLVRTYTMESLNAGVMRIATDIAEYTRKVSYDLSARPAGVQLRCEAKTTIPGLGRFAARSGAKAERKPLNRSLDILSTLAQGRTPSWLQRSWRNSGLSPQAL